MIHPTDYNVCNVFEEGEEETEDEEEEENEEENKREKKEEKKEAAQEDTIHVNELWERRNTNTNDLTHVNKDGE